MSASLVGSEMCIRDSHQVKRNQSATGGIRQARGGQIPQESTEYCMVSVSYTHLTLLTICSV
eukprot:4256634-Alexandrium_andersonii.AAC.1